jgi:hypothetical protein
MTDIAQLLARIERLEQENAVLRAENKWLKKKLFGGGQGEKLDQAQLALELGELAKIAAPPVPPDGGQLRAGATPLRAAHRAGGDVRPPAGAGDHHH